MTDDTLVTRLTDYGRALIAHGQEIVRDGRPVVPLLVVVNREGDTAAMLVPLLPETVVRREDLIRQLVTDLGGIAFLFFDDAYLRDARTLDVKGEALVASIQTATGVCAAVVGRYHREPTLTFDPPVLEGGGLLYDVWTPATVH